MHGCIARGWLQQQLGPVAAAARCCPLLPAALPHHLGVPALPLLPLAADFIETRRAALTIFLNRVVGGFAGCFGW